MINKPKFTWNYGYNARLAGTPQRDNPHPENSDDYRAWNSGWWTAYMAYVDEQQIRLVSL